MEGAYYGLGLPPPADDAVDDDWSDRSSQWSDDGAGYDSEEHRRWLDDELKKRKQQLMESKAETIRIDARLRALVAAEG